jgi:hypothetical protein
MASGGHFWEADLFLDFSYILGLRLKMLRMSLLGSILATFWAWDQKSFKWASWGPFWLHSGPEANFQKKIGLPKVASSKNFKRSKWPVWSICDPGPFLGRFAPSILAIFWAWGQKGFKWASWGPFWLHSGPEAKNASNEPPVAHFGYILGLRPGWVPQPPLRATVYAHVHIRVHTSIRTHARALPGKQNSVLKFTRWASEASLHNRMGVVGGWGGGCLL